MSERLELVHGLVRVDCDTVTGSRGVGGEFCAFALITIQGSYLSQKSHCHTPAHPRHRTNP